MLLIYRFCPLARFITEESQMHLHEAWSPFTWDGRPIEALREIAVIVGIDPDLPPHRLAKAFGDRYVTQGIDRWKEPPVILNPWQEQLIRGLLSKLGMLKETGPEFDGVCPTEVDGVLNLGGILTGTVQKFDKLNVLSQTIHIADVFHLGSDRGLETYEIEVLSAMGANASCLTEFDMMRFFGETTLWQHGLQNTDRHHFVRAPKTTGHRAHTGDSLHELLRTYRLARGARLIVMSLNPHVHFQACVVARYLQKSRPDLLITMAAPSAQLGPQEMSFYMGAVSRWLLRWVEAQQELGRPRF